MSKPSKDQPMDTNAREQAVGTTSTNNQRVCYAVKTLVAEVLDLFPETPVEYSNYDGRNTALAVTFDLTALDNDAAIDLLTLLTLIENDARVSDVMADDSVVLVSMKPSARTKDNPDPFGLADALLVLAGDEYSTDVFEAEGAARYGEMIGDSL